MLSAVGFRLQLKSMRAIMYHYVRPAPVGLPYFRYLHVEDFEDQLDWLAARHRFVTRKEFFDARKRGTPPEGVVLTFDDGFSDHLDHVLPALASRNLFGVFYVCTAPYRTGRLLDVHRIHLILGRLGGHEALRRLGAHVKEGMLEHWNVTAFKEQTYARQNNDEATTLFKRTLNYLISYQCRARILDEIFAEEFDNERDIARDFYLTADGIRALAAAGCVIGSHGINHLVFSKLPHDEQRREIRESFADLGTVLGKPIETFCFPYGGHHTFNSETLSFLEEAGSILSFSVEPRDVTAKDLREAPHALPRFDCNMFPHGGASLGDIRPDMPRSSEDARL